jgi:hypothetical protein
VDGIDDRPGHADDSPGQGPEAPTDHGAEGIPQVHRLALSRPCHPPNETTPEQPQHADEASTGECPAHDGPPFDLATVNPAAARLGVPFAADKVLLDPLLRTRPRMALRSW